MGRASGGAIAITNTVSVDPHSAELGAWYLRAVDASAALDAVNRFIELIDARDKAYRANPSPYNWEPLDEETTELSVQVLTLTRVAFPSMQWRKYGNSIKWDSYRENAVLFRGWLKTAAETNSILGPTGPQLSATSLHSVVWNAAVQLWDSGYHWEAVRNAGEQLTPLLQAKLGRFDLSSTRLVSEAFSSKPPEPSAPRLRFTQYAEGSDEWKSAHTGALSFGQGCMMAIRNLATHTHREPDQQQALEQLAALSVFARMIDEAEVVRAP